MADEAVLTIRFRDESSPSGGGFTVAPQGGGVVPGSTLAADQQAAITAAGGVGARASANNQASTGGVSPPITMSPVPAAAPLPVPQVTTAGGGDPLLRTVQGIVQADPSVSIAELVKALGIPTSRAQTLLAAASIPPGGQQAPTATQPLPIPPAAAAPVPPINPAPAAATPPAGPQPPPVPPPVQGQTPPPAPPPIQQPPAGPAGATAQGVQATVNAIAGLAAQGGPLAGALGQAAAATTALPGVGAGLAGAAPALAAAAPYIVAGAAALAVPAAAALTINSIAQTARGQIGGLSADVAGAEAEAGVRQLLANLRTSQILGDEIADSVRARSRISAAGQGIRDQLFEGPMRDWATAQQILAKAAEGADSFLGSHGLVREYGGRALLSGLVLGPAGVATSIGATAIGKTLREFTDSIPLLRSTLQKLRDWLHDNDSKGKANPITFFDAMSTPVLPPPFTDSGMVPAPESIRLGSRIPGLSI